MCTPDSRPKAVFHYNTSLSHSPVCCSCYFDGLYVPFRFIFSLFVYLHFYLRCSYTNPLFMHCLMSDCKHSLFNDVRSIRYISCVCRRAECFSLLQNSLHIFVFIVSQKSKWDKFELVPYGAFKCTCQTLPVESDETLLRSNVVFYLCG